MAWGKTGHVSHFFTFFMFSLKRCEYSRCTTPFETSYDEWGKREKFLIQKKVEKKRKRNELWLGISQNLFSGLPTSGCFLSYFYIPASFCLYEVWGVKNLQRELLIRGKVSYLAKNLKISDRGFSENHLELPKNHLHRPL